MKIGRKASGKMEAVLEDGTVIPTTSGAIAAQFLFEGKDLDGEEVRELKRNSARFLCRDRALEMLSRRRYSEKELRDRLRMKGETDDSVDYAVDWLGENRFLDDESYAASVARHYAGKGYGTGRVRSELARRGIRRELWDGALEEMPSADAKLDQLVSAKLKDPEDREAVRRLGAALYRRGYGWDEIRSALRRHCAETEEDI